MKTFLYLAACGLIFSTIFLLRYAGIDGTLYEVRDDGVITMSVGRHIIDYGFVGVSPSGPIVEASSSPAQTLIYALAYAATDVHYADYAWAQTVVASILIGLLAGLLFTRKPWAGLATVGALAMGLSFTYPFFLWHGSGMENAVTHLLVLASLVGCALMIRAERVSYLWALPIALTCFARFELIISVAALMGLFALFWWISFRRLGALWFAIAVGVLVMGGHALRVDYFGALFPNTAAAQSISPSDRLVAVLAGAGWVWKDMLGVARANLWQSHFWVGLAFLPLLALLPKPREFKFLGFAALVLLAIALISPVVFGRPRIDLPRTYTHFALVAFMVPALCFYLGLVARHRLYLLGNLAGVVGIGVVLSQGAPYYLGWEVTAFNQIRERFVQVAEENQIQRPLISNPDLGAMTWYKQHNVLDLGRLGSPVLSRLIEDRAVADYILDFARPDFIESHGSWTRGFCKSVFLDPRFEARYRPMTGTLSAAEMCALAKPRVTFWQRKDIELGSETTERRFLDRLQQSLDVDAIAEELGICAASDADCGYVVRTVFRFTPELSESGEFDQVLALFEREVDRDYLSAWRDARATRRIVAAMRQGEVK